MLLGWPKIVNPEFCDARYEFIQNGRLVNSKSWCSFMPVTRFIGSLADNFATYFALCEWAHLTLAARWTFGFVRLDKHISALIILEGASSGIIPSMCHFNGTEHW